MKRIIETEKTKYSYALTSAITKYYLFAMFNYMKVTIIIPMMMESQCLSHICDKIPNFY